MNCWNDEGDGGHCHGDETDPGCFSTLCRVDHVYLSRRETAGGRTFPNTAVGTKVRGRSVTNSI